MLTSLAALFFLLLLVSGSAVLLRRRTEEMLPVCFCGVILWLYPFYLCSAVRVGLPLLCAGAVLVFLAGWHRAGGLRRYAAAVLTSGTVAYLVTCLIFLVFFSGNFVSRHDELRLWGAVPKAIHATGKLQLGHDSPIFATMQSYPPALPLLGYFFTAFDGQFSEGALFVGYACMALAFFVPGFAAWNWSRWKLLAPAGLIVMLVPFVFTSHNGDNAMFAMTLFVDPLLGIVMGYCFVLVSRSPQRRLSDSVFFALALAVLCLLKSTGIAFAGFALVVYLILERGEWNRRMLLPVLAIPASVGLWRLLLALYDVHSLVPLRLHWLSGEEIQNVLRALVSWNMIAYKVPLGFLVSFACVYGVLLGLFFILERRCGNKKRSRWLAAGFLGSTIAYIYGYALLYGQTLESFQRYMAAPLLGLAVYLLTQALPRCVSWRPSERLCRLKRGTAAILAAVCFASAVGLMALWRSVFPPYESRQAADRDASRIRQAVEQSRADGESGWVYLVMAGDGVALSHYHHRIFFDLISEDINIRNGFAQTQVAIPGLENPAQVWAEQLLDRCDFVYLLSVEDALRPVFAQLSQDAPEPDTLYRVCRSDNEYGVELRRA